MVRIVFEYNIPELFAEKGKGVLCSLKAYTFYIYRVVELFRNSVFFIFIRGPPHWFDFQISDQ